MKMRKQVYDLTTEDLDFAPIWEYAQDEEGEEGHDEATVRPVEPARSLDAVEVMCVAKANFRLADGTSMDGFLSPGRPDDTDLGHLQPAIFSKRGQISFWCGIIEPSRERLEAAYAALEKTPQEIFPIFFRWPCHPATRSPGSLKASLC
ncbi:hypothetical protein [Pseudoduganella sp. OTU4001]|uniref:hypothetical protein n=1 Tax=Pseudoduganella sp. OTU4001 TaxID=3043854 RepID=UPI00313E091D